MDRKVALTGLVIGACSLLLLLAGIGRPSMPVYDEYAYVAGARSILHGAEDLNPEHPPLAKFLIAGGMELAGDKPFGWRLAGAIFGALTLVAVFFWTYLLLGNWALALTAAALTFLDNFLFVMSRVAMLDVFYFGFVMWGVLTFTAAILGDMRIERRRLLLLASGLLFGLAGACKWNAVVTLAAVALVAVILYWRNTHHLRETGVTYLALAFAVVPVAVYVLSFSPLCYRFHHPFTFAGIVSMNHYIWRYHVECPGNPALDVPWYRWFFRTSPERGLSYLMGNFVVVWTGFFALLACAWRFCKSFFCKSWALAEGIVVLLYAVNLLQWVVIPQRRLVYYYYYPSAVFLGVAIVLVFSRLPQRVFGVRLNVAILLAAAVFFLYCYPHMAALESPYDCMFGCWS